MSAIKEIAVPEGSLTSPRGLIRSVLMKFGMGSRFAVGLMIFLLGVLVVVMVSKRFGLPTRAIERAIT